MSKFNVGDRVRRVKNPAKWAPIGYETIVTSDGHNLTYTDKQGDRDVLINYPDWEIVEDGPVRTVTRKEIVPGEYGKVIVATGVMSTTTPWVSCEGNLTSDELRSAAMVFSQLAEALEDQQ